MLYQELYLLLEAFGLCRAAPSGRDGRRWAVAGSALRARHHLERVICRLADGSCGWSRSLAACWRAAASAAATATAYAAAAAAAARPITAVRGGLLVTGASASAVLAAC